jgi:hypothetical protein
MKEELGLDPIAEAIAIYEYTPLAPASSGRLSTIIARGRRLIRGGALVMPALAGSESRPRLNVNDPPVLARSLRLEHAIFRGIAPLANLTSRWDF